MSSLDQDEANKELQRAVPWVSDPHHRERRDNETRRLQEDVLEAARRLESASATVPSQPLAEPQTAVGFRLPQPRMREDKAFSEERARKIWAQLKPEFVSSPPRERFGMPGIAMAAGIVGAIAASALVALVVVNVVHHPMISADVAGEEQATKGSLLAAALGDLAKVSETQANMTHADERAVPAESLLASTPADEVAATKPHAADDLQLAKIEPARPEIAAPAPSPVPTASPVPAASAVAQPWSATPLPPDEIASLRNRARNLIAAGDIASARLVLTLLAEAGDAEAAVTLAGTFDPAALAKLRAIGVRGDPAKARAWYARAAELGSEEARQRLQALR